MPPRVCDANHCRLRDKSQSRVPSGANPSLTRNRVVASITSPVSATADHVASPARFLSRFVPFFSMCLEDFRLESTSRKGHGQLTCITPLAACRVTQIADVLGSVAHGSALLRANQSS